ncbi:MAG: GDSL-type esterase/lipase family protein [Bacteroidales bacterium]
MKSYYFLFVYLLTVIINLQAQSKISKFNIVFIGNSITEGSNFKDPATQAPPATTVNYLNEHNCQVQFANCGVSGSTTVDFLPSTHKQFPKVLAAADSFYKKELPLVFSIKLGTNDSAIKGPNGSPVFPEDYKKNMLLIIDSLLLRYPKSHFVLHCPIWYSPNTHNNSLYMAEGLARLQTYVPQILAICKLRSTKVFVGDRKAYGFFKNNYKQYLRAENGNSGIFYLHPNVLGAEKLGEFWAVAIMKYVQ